MNAPNTVIPIADPWIASLHSAPHGIDHTRKLREQAVAGVLYDPAPVFRDLWVDKLRKMGLEAFVRPFLVLAHQARVTGHISGEDGGKAAGRGHVSDSSPWGRSSSLNSTTTRPSSDDHDRRRLGRVLDPEIV